MSDLREEASLPVSVFRAGPQHGIDASDAHLGPVQSTPAHLWQVSVRLGFTFIFPSRENCQRRAGLRLFSVREIVSGMTALCFPDLREEKRRV